MVGISLNIYKATFFAVFLMANIVGFNLAKGQVEGPLPRHYQITEADGLPSNTVYDIAQDKMGFMWFATDRGVARFDGKEMMVFGVEDGLPDNEILRLYADSKNRVWFCDIMGHFGYFQNDKMTINSSAELKNAAQFGSHFDHALEDQLGQIWFFTRKDGVFCWTGDRFHHFSPNSRAYLHGMKSNGEVIFSSRSSVDPNIGGKQVSLCSISPAVREIKTLSMWADGAFPSSAMGLLNDSSLFALKMSGFNITKFVDSLESTPVPGNFGLPSNAVCTMTKLDETHFLLAMESYGCVTIKVDPGSNLFQLDKAILKGISVNRAIMDKDRSVWMSSVTQGVYYAPASAVCEYNFTQAQFKDHIKSLSVGLDGALWCFRGENIYQEVGGVLQLKYTSTPGIFLPEWKSALELSEKRLVLAGSSGLVWLDVEEQGDRGTTIDLALQNEKRQIQSVPTILSSVSLGYPGCWWIGLYPVKDILKLSDESVLVGTTHGLLITDVSDNLNGVAIPQTRIVVPTIRINCLERTSDGTIYVATTEGLFTFADNQLQVVSRVNDLLKYKITDLAALPDSSLVISTSGQGMFHLRHNGIKHLGLDHGLPSMELSDLWPSEEGTLFCATAKGICAFRLQQHELVQDLTWADQLKELGPSEFENVITIGDRLLASRKNRLFEIRKSETSRVENSFPVYFTGFNLNSKQVNLPSDTSLAYFQSNLTLKYAALDYPSMGNITYQTRLLGADSNWVDSRYNFVQFSSLRPGKYEFQVRAISSKGVRSGNTASFSFRILPPWYETWWFRVLIAMVISLLGFAAFRVRLRAVRRRGELELKMMESEQKALRSQMNPHFIFNSLSSIQRFLLVNNTNETIRYLTKFGRLMRSILDNSSEPMILIEDELSALRLYLELESLRAEGKFSFDIKVDQELVEEGCRMPPLIIQPFVENAIWHGIMPKEGNGFIQIEISDRGEVMTCKVTDDGIGRQRAKELKGESQEGHKSHGMKITAERLALLNKGRANAITLAVIDLKDELGNACGTLVVVEIPKQY